MTDISSEKTASSADGERPLPATSFQAPASIGARFGSLAKKELREVLRDRRTIVTLILMPVLVYPLLSIAFQQLMTTQTANLADIVYRIGVADQKAVEDLYSLIAIGDAVIQARSGSQTPATPSSPSSTPEGSGPSNEPPEPPPTEADLREFTLRKLPPPSRGNIQWVSVPEHEMQLRVQRGDLDVAVLISERRRQANPAGGPPRPDPPREFRSYDLQLHYRPTSDFGRTLASFVERRIVLWNEQRLLRRLLRFGENRPPPLTLKMNAVSSEEKNSFSLAAVVPLVLVMMTITGAVYPSIDVTAGERERGTLESLMAAPIPRMRLLAAKYVAVVTVAILTAMANVAAMLVTLYSTGLGRLLLGDAGFSLATMAQVFLLLILFAAFFSAVLLTITSFARSFKEAQAYLIPLMLVALGPGLLSLMPEIRLNLGLAVTPLANLVLLSRDILQGNAQGWSSLVAITSTFLYAIGAISLAARVFGGDAILYGASGSWTDLWRRTSNTRSAPTVDAAALTVAGLFPLYFMAGGLLGQLGDASIATRQAVLAVISVILFLVLPLLIAAWQRVVLPGGLLVTRAHWLAYFGAALLGLSLWPLAHEIFLWGRKLGFDPLTQVAVERIEKLLVEWRSLSLIVVVATMALVPAVCEELFFRGFLLSAFRSRLPGWIAIVVSGGLFGLFHTFVGSTLTPERFLPTTFLGLVLAAVCWRTRSILPGILLHFVNNSLVLVMARYRDEWTVHIIGTGTAERLPVVWHLGALGGLIVGSAMIWFATRNLDGQVAAAPVIDHALPT